MADFKLGQKICFVCHSPIEFPVSPCNKCGKYYHKSGNCNIIHSRSCNTMKQDKDMRDFLEPDSNHWKPLR